MEFRIFFPIYKSVPFESTDINETTTLNSYDLAIQELVQMFAVAESDMEVRTDNYLVGNDYFGVKYRDKKKLELKIRTEVIDLVIEKWTKKKLGKDKFSRYKESIINYLFENGINCSSYDISCIEKGSFIEVKKARSTVLRQSSDYFASMEICFLTTSSSPSSSTYDWMSIACEGDIESIKRCIISDRILEKALSILDMSFAIATALAGRGIGINRHRYPVISGYPAWIRIISKGEMNPEDVSINRDKLMYMKSVRTPAARNENEVAHENELK